MTEPPSTKNAAGKPLLTALLILAVVILAGLTTIFGMIARDYFMTASANAHPSNDTLTTTPVIKTGLAIEVIQTFDLPTPYQPMPTETITSTSTQAPIPTNTLTSTPIPTETHTPEPEWPPESAQISNIIGYPQSYTLDCESRSAVDWAAYFGVSIGELDFLDALPHSDDPNLGFVGDPNGVGGFIPPNSYGVHAAPVARLLRAYGLPAQEDYGFNSNELKNEVASGKPVIAWVIIGTGLGYSLEYTTEAGEVIDVAPYEHTVIVIGYDPYGVTILDGGMLYWRDWTTFEASFGVLNNMAIVYREE